MTDLILSRACSSAALSGEVLSVCFKISVHGKLYYATAPSLKVFIISSQAKACSQLLSIYISAIILYFTNRHYKLLTVHKETHRRQPLNWPN